MTTSLLERLSALGHVQSRFFTREKRLERKKEERRIEKKVACPRGNSREEEKKTEEKKKKRVKVGSDGRERSACFCGVGGVLRSMEGEYEAVAKEGVRN